MTTDFVNILGVKVSGINPEKARNVVALTIKENRKGYVCVTGVHGVIEAQKDRGFRAILNNALLCTPDGMPLVWLGKYCGRVKQMDRVYGPDLMLDLCQSFREKNYRHFLYGGADGVVESLKQNLERKYPGINIVGCFTPPFRPLNSNEEEKLLSFVNKTKPHVFWVGLSTPKQEKFMAAYLSKLDVSVMIGVGAAFDFHTGRVKQAPTWIQRSGLEWLFRFVCEPGRLWKRYLYNNPVFIYKIIKQLLGLERYSVN